MPKNMRRRLLRDLRSRASGLSKGLINGSVSGERSSRAVAKTAVPTNITAATMVTPRLGRLSSAGRFMLAAKVPNTAKLATAIAKMLKRSGFSAHQRMVEVAATVATSAPTIATSETSLIAKSSERAQALKAAEKTKKAARLPAEVMMTGSSVESGSPARPSERA